MFQERHIPHKRPGERIITFVRPHWIEMVRNITFFIFQSAIPFVLYVFVWQITPELLENPFTYVLIVLLSSLYLLMALQQMYNKFLDYHLDIWVVTNHRIISIIQNNLFNRVISEHAIEKIQDVQARQVGILQSFLNFGTIEVQTAGEKTHFSFKNIPDPFKIAQEVNHLVHTSHTIKK